MMTWVKSYLEQFMIQLKTISACLQEMEKDTKVIKEAFTNIRRVLHERSI